MQTDYVFLIYSGVIVVLQQRTSFPTIQHVCIHMLIFANWCDISCHKTTELMVWEIK